MTRNLANSLRFMTVEKATSLWTTVRGAFKHGVNLFDTAESYGIPNGLSEERLGVALAGIRHQVYVVSKIEHWGKHTGQGIPKNSVDMIRVCAHASLHRLRTDWIDVLLCHEADIEDPSVYLEAFEMLKQRGRTRQCRGCSRMARQRASGCCEPIKSRLPSTSSSRTPRFPATLYARPLNPNRNPHPPYSRIGL